MIYAQSPDSAFIPSTDVNILNESINRRKRRVSRHHSGNTNHLKKSQNDGALAIITAEESGTKVNALQMSPLPLPLSVTTVQGEVNIKKKNSTNESKDDGMLVVCFAISTFYVIF